jgi:vancomycin resistance protein YoaR
MAILQPYIHRIQKPFKTHKPLLNRIAKTSFWFFLGAFLGFFFFASFLYIYYRETHQNLVYTGVMINGTHFGGKTHDQVRKHFAEHNTTISQSKFILTAPHSVATISARQINLGYDEKLIADQSFNIGRSSNTLSDMRLMLQAYFDGVDLRAAHHYDEQKLNTLIEPLQKKLEIKPIDAVFKMDRGRVTEFKLSKDGQTMDMPKLKEDLYERMQTVSTALDPQTITIKVPIKIVAPAVATDKNMGIIELIGKGTSQFAGSIANRAYNINLASSRVHGALIAPGETFSFNKTIGDISTLTGYKQAYVIQNGKTVQGDGGGVCQVSTTLFRAVLNAGLPIAERNQHAYRVGYYEQNSPPGIDAAIYTPTVDFKFKNDTGASILIQAYPDMVNYRLVFELYGTKDGRQVTMTKPVILKETPAPEPLYQDDPNLPKGEVKQVDFAAAGANVYFTRTVTKNGKTLLSDKFVSNYRPWQAIYLRGTKE